MRVEDETNLVQRARLFATGAHAAIDQRRKYTQAPYIMHPRAVVYIVSGVPHTPEMLAAAWLHDTVEDTAVTLDDISNEFGSDVRNLVFWLTDKSKPTDGNRQTRKAIDRAHSAQAPAEAQTIKIADLIDNTATIEHYDPTFAMVYRREKELLLAMLTRGDPTLRKRAQDQLATFDERKLQDHLEKFGGV